MADVYSVVELNGNGTVRQVRLSTFNQEEALRVEDELTKEGANNRRYVTLSGEVDLPKPKPVAQKKKAS